VPLDENSDTSLQSAPIVEDTKVHAQESHMFAELDGAFVEVEEGAAEVTSLVANESVEMTFPAELEVDNNGFDDWILV